MVKVNFFGKAGYGFEINRNFPGEVEIIEESGKETGAQWLEVNCEYGKKL